MQQALTASEAAAEQARQEERERRDWFEMLQNEAAFRVWVRLLVEMGVGRLMTTEEDMRMRNIADQILDRMADADPKSYIRILRTLKNI